MFNGEVIGHDTFDYVVESSGWLAACHLEQPFATPRRFGSMFRIGRKQERQPQFGCFRVILNAAENGSNEKADSSSRDFVHSSLRPFNEAIQKLS